MQDISVLKTELLAQVAASNEPQEVLKSPRIKALYDKIRTLDPSERGAYGKAVNELKVALEAAVEQRINELEDNTVQPLDITAPWDINGQSVTFLPTRNGTIHPLMREITVLADIFERMGFQVEDSREIDDQYHMFETLNFPKGHPARDDYDTFMTVETDANGEPLIAPAHTSTMQNRVLKKYRSNLESDQPIAAVVPDRVFRNEDLDARHEHTFYQVEGIFVAKGVNAGMLIATLQEFLQEYYGKKLDVRVNPFYFPFTEPSFEFALSCPFCDGTGVVRHSELDSESSESESCKVCSGEGWIELLGCGMIHPNVLKAANIDPNEYTGFAFGCGIDRLVMMKYGIEDVRHFESAKLDFLRQF